MILSKQVALTVDLEKVGRKTTLRAILVSPRIVRNLQAGATP